MWSSGAASRGAPSHTRAGSLGVVTILAMSCALACESPPLGEALTANEVVHPEHGAYELTVPAGWRSVPPGTLDEDPGELELSRDDERAYLIARSLNVRSLNLDEIVSPRRETLLSSGHVEFEERRFLLPRSPNTPASLARYRAGSLVFLILSASQPPVGVELLGAVYHGSGLERELLDVMMSLSVDATRHRPLESGSPEAP